MALCPSCGTDNHESLTECMYCGHTLNPIKKTTYISNRTTGNTIDGKFIVYCIIAFSIPIVGFFLYRSYSKTKEGKIILFLATIQLFWSIVTSYIQSSSI